MHQQPRIESLLMENVSESTRLPEEERHKLLVKWNATQIAYPKDKCIHQLFEAQVERSPDAIAVVFEDEHLTYRELNQRANQLSHYLRHQGVGPEVLVGICVDRSLEMVIGLIGILKAGGAYVPLDPRYPKERIAFMLKDSQVAVLLTQEKLVAELPVQGVHLACLDKDGGEVSAESEENPCSGATPENLAYVIYTSGSTGTPKGVLGLHRGVVNRFFWMWETFAFEAQEVCCQKTSLSFVDSVWEIFGPLLKGVPTVIIPDAVLKEPSRLVQTLAAKNVTRLVLVPSLVRALLYADIDFQFQLPKLKYWISSGETLSLSLCQRFYDRVPHATLFNFYGSTEVTADATWYDTREGRLLVCVPIGRPIANMQIYILNHQLQRVPIGTPGELHVGGIGLARGYLNQPGLTAERFITNPFSVEPGARLYKTGDRARYLPDGNVEFLGRIDHQVKIRGFRIEPGEIEVVLKQYPAIREAVIVAWENTPGDKRLVAYIVFHQNQASSLSGIHDYLNGKLADCMVPTVFVPLETLPLTPNGKIDRRALPEPDSYRRDSKDEFIAPTTPTEEILSGIWAEVLGKEKISLDDNFFEQGGDSLLAVRLITKIEKIFATNLPLTSLLHAPTVAELSNILRQESHTES